MSIPRPQRRAGGDSESIYLLDLAGHFKAEATMHSWPFAIRTLLLWVAFTNAYTTNWTITPNNLNPQAVPLAVKSPYVNAWAPLAYGAEPVSIARPRFWTSVVDILEWYASILVDGTPYLLLGSSTESGPSNITAANQTQQTYTASQTSYRLTTGPVDVNLTFLSPIEVANLTRLSIPFSYLQITVESNDGNSHDVQIYSDVYGQWICDDNYSPLNWTATLEDDVTYLQMQYVSPSPFAESADRPRDGVMYYAAKNTSALSWQIGIGQDLRTSFAEGTSRLSNSVDGNSSRTVGSSDGSGEIDYEALAFVYDLGEVDTSQTVSFAIGVVRDPAIQYVDGSGRIENRSSFYWSDYSSISSLVSDVVNGVDDAMSAASAFDAQIASAAGSISSTYGPLAYLSVRQVFGSLDYTVGRDSTGKFNNSDVKIFMKNLGSVGLGGVNAVDVLYASMPIYLYLAPDILGYLLEPLFDAQESSGNTLSYAAIDLGWSYPKATGNLSTHNEGIEQSANMIIMTLAQAQSSGDTSLLSRHFALLDRWGTYLINNCLYPGEQTTSASDNIAVLNQTNLALKGIVAIGAMSKICEVAGASKSAQRYNDAAQSLFQEWKLLAITSSGIALGYGMTTTGLIYNLYADKLLRLNLIDTATYDLQTSVYRGYVSQDYGLAMDLSTQNGSSRADWMLYAAAAASNSSIQQSMIAQVINYVGASTTSNLPFAVEYSVSNGTEIYGFASPAVGAMFSFLALLAEVKNLRPNSSEERTALISGVVIGGVFGIGILVACALSYRSRRYSFKRNKISLTGVKTRRGSLESKFDASLLPTVDLVSAFQPETSAMVQTSPFPAAGSKAAEALMEARNRLLQQYREALNLSNQSDAWNQKQRTATHSRTLESPSGTRIAPSLSESPTIHATVDNRRSQRHPSILPGISHPQKRPRPVRTLRSETNTNVNDGTLLRFVLSPLARPASGVPFSLSQSEVDSNPLPVPTSGGFTASGTAFPLSMSSLLNEARQNTPRSRSELEELQEEILRLRHAIDTIMTEPSAHAEESWHAPPEYVGTFSNLASQRSETRSDTKCP